MHEAVNRVRSGLGIHSHEWCDIDSPAWCEDRHFMAISLLYDIAVLSYSPITKQWHVFSVDVARGYVCLLSTLVHIDVLRGFMQHRPAVPARVLSHDDSTASATSINGHSTAMVLKF